MQDPVHIIQDLTRKIGERFSFILEKSPRYLGNARALARDINKGKRTDSVYGYKKGTNMHLLRAIELANLLGIHYSEFVIFDNSIPDFTHEDKLDSFDRLQVEISKINERLEQWMTDAGLTNTEIELLIEEFSTIGESSFQKIRKLKSSQIGPRLLTYSKPVIVLKRSLYDLLK